MTSTLQTNFKNNTNTYIMKTPENQAVKKDDTNVKNTQPKESEKSKSKDGNILLYSLGGLAVIGFGYLAGKKFLVKAPKSEQNNSGCNLLDILAKRLWLISVSPPDWANAPVVTPEASKSSSLMLFIIICHLFFSL